MFVGFITGGDGGIHYSVDCALQLIEGGVDIIELGLPFSDPIADGPVIQRSSHRALQSGTTSTTLLEMGKKIREKSEIPLILFSYFNPLLQKGKSYLDELKSAGFNGVIIVDLSQPHPYFEQIKRAGLQRITLATPSTEEDRLKAIKPEGFLYYACQKGTTGIKKRLPNDFALQIRRLRGCTSIPIVAGFGIASRESAKAALKEADGFVVGSAFVQLMEAKAPPEQLKLLAQKINPT